MIRLTIRKALFLILTLLPFAVNAQILINELLAKNVSWNMDEGFNFSNWVEVYNSSISNSYNLSSFYFTDNLNNPTKWKPASKVILPKSYSILYFERDEIAGHATFKLSPEGGTLYLLNTSRTIIDSVTYPSQLRNISWGRKTDNPAKWSFNEVPTPGTINSSIGASAVRCPNPSLNTPGGLNAQGVLLFVSCGKGDTVYYTTDGSEPTRKSVFYTSPIALTKTTPVRAKAFCKGKLSSDVVTTTYFINQRETHLPMVSIVTNDTYLFDPKIGIYVNGDGTNGKMGNGASSPMNWNADWDRPVNYEFFDTTHTVRLNQELDIKILGGWTKTYPLKSIAIMPKKKFGNNKLKYEIFAATKPGMKYHDIQMRNSGNDFYLSMMRDAFMQSIVQKRMNLDYQAYEPSVIFINGVYYGIENLQERSNESYVYSNYGIDEDDIYEIEATNINVNTENDIATDTAYSAFTSFLKNSDLTSGPNYQRVCQLMDVDNFISYNVAEIFFGNTDWPYNNCKIWRKKVDGTWRWILTDTDFGFNLQNSTGQTHNTLTFALGENQSGNISGYSIQPEWSTIILTRLMTNEQFKRKFIDKFAIHLSTTFAPARIDHIMDSLASKISNEIVYHKLKYGSSRTLANDLAIMKTFSAERATNMWNFLSARLVNSAASTNIVLSSNLNKASYTLNEEPIPDANLTLRYFQNSDFSLQANPVPGYRFKQWERAAGTTTTSTLIPMGSTWNYYDGSALPSTNWNTSAYSDVTWKTGAAPLGYGGRGEVTTIGYGSDVNNKYITSYYRKTININNLSGRNNFELTVFVDDGAILYVNGKELGRVNMPAGTASYAMMSSTVNNGVTGVFNIPVNLLNEGTNLIAVEVHQYLSSSSDVIFNLGLTSNLIGESLVSTQAVYSGTLTSALNLRAIYEADATEVQDIRVQEAVKTVEIYPTLVTDWLTVKHADGKKLMIFDLTGTCVHKTVCTSDEQFLQVGFLKSGLYLLRIGNQTIKFVKR